MIVFLDQFFKERTFSMKFVIIMAHDFKDSVESAHGIDLMVILILFMVFMPKTDVSAIWHDSPEVSRVLGLDFKEIGVVRYDIEIRQCHHLVFSWREQI